MARQREVKSVQSAFVFDNFKVADFIGSESRAEEHYWVPFREESLLTGSQFSEIVDDDIQTLDPPYK